MSVEKIKAKLIDQFEDVSGEPIFTIANRLIDTYGISAHEAELMALGYLLKSMEVSGVLVNVAEAAFKPSVRFE